EIRVNQRPVSVTMRTPGHDEELATGFLLTEGIISKAEDIDHAGSRDDCNVVDVTLSAGYEVDFSRLTRHVFASSSCGVCGKATIDAVQQQFPPVDTDVRVASATLRGLPDKLRAAQPTFAQTGGLHAAAIFNERGELLILREDVG